MATTKTTTPAPSGNRFEYYAPPAAVAGSMAPTKTFVFTKLGSGAIEAPATKVKKRYPKATTAPFGTMGPLDEHREISDADWVSAAIECGYGKEGQWSPQLALGKAQRLQLKRYLLLRHEMATTCMELDSNNARSLRKFAGKLEKSELGALSFIAGTFGTYLAAKYWLEAAGENVSAFLHYDIYTKATATLVKVSSATSAGGYPDFLVESDKGGWHVFESKGGRREDRWQRLAEGLNQLNGVSSVGWDGQPLKAPVSKVCVHTIFEADCPIHITVVDPPDGTAQSDGDEPLRLIKSVCRGLVALEAIDTFHVLVGSQELSPDARLPDWSVGRTERFGGWTVGIRTAMLQGERRLRNRVEAHLLLREILAETLAQSGAVSAHHIADEFARRVTPRIRSGEGNFWVEKSREAIQLVKVDDDVLVQYARVIGLDEVVGDNYSPRRAPPAIQLGRPGSWALTPGGLLLLAPSRGDVV